MQRYNFDFGKFGNAYYFVESDKLLLWENLLWIQNALQLIQNELCIKVEGCFFKATFNSELGETVEHIAKTEIELNNWLSYMREHHGIENIRVFYDGKERVPNIPKY
jgi:hypothetical protein